MTQGAVSKLVTTFGSRWGRIQPEGDSREVFFNPNSLDGDIDFLSLSVGQTVAFEEHADHVNGSHAEHVIVTPASASPPDDARHPEQPSKEATI
jgi:cold shock CspA family protein